MFVTCCTARYLFAYDLGGVRNNNQNNSLPICGDPNLYCL